MREYLNKLKELNRRVIIIDGKYFIMCNCCDRILHSCDSIIDLLDYADKELLIKNKKCLDND